MRSLHNFSIRVVKSLHVIQQQRYAVFQIVHFNSDTDSFKLFNGIHFSDGQGSVYE